MMAMPLQSATDVSNSDLATLSRAPGEDIAAFLDRFAARIARAYHAGDLPYAIGDSILGDLRGLLEGLWMDGIAHRWPALFQQVHDAFEAGAYHRRADGSDDPVATYTDPAIAAIVARLDGGT
ncbi:hypothetical protein [Sphingomonas endophytica]|uniref:Uncharacterized protein n=1 Tax=Sphingomonas endophytica TaxID=869719 RepID=A0A147I603_9SPHN|nr:hypothetical protein [Sphingomonas endophytica]KTT74154.1 hypothetical protein NS334_06245 [Sphingomonas endophytica]